MKKFGLLALMAILAGSVFAQEAGHWSIGGRAGMAFGFHSDGEFTDLLEDELLYYGISTDISSKGKLNFLLAGYGTYSFTERFSLQMELDLMFNQGIKLSAEGDSVDITYTSLDMPVLAKYAFMLEPVVLGVLGGPHLSIPFGDIEADVGNYSAKGDTNFMTFGVTLGGFVGYPLGPGRIVGDLRFIFDFNSVDIEEDGYSASVMTRRALAFTVGYEYSF